MFFEMIKKAIIFLSVLYFASDIFNYFLERVRKILEAINNFPDKALVTFSLYFLLAVVLAAEILIILWIFIPKIPKRKKEG